MENLALSAGRVVASDREREELHLDRATGNRQRESRPQRKSWVCESFGLWGGTGPTIPIFRPSVRERQHTFCP